MKPEMKPEMKPGAKPDAKIGKLYGIGVGPGDSELITVKGARLLNECKRLFVPKARVKSESLALDIAKGYIGADTKVCELVFPMITDHDKLEKHWRESAKEIADVLKNGEDACFLTLGDSLLYSTYIYLVRALRELMPEAQIETVPGVTAFSGVAALTNFPVGVAKDPVTIVPASDENMDGIRKALRGNGTVVLMKIGKCLHEVLNILEEENVIDNAVFVAYAGQEKQRIETDLKKLKKEKPETGYLSTILVRANGGGK